MAESPPDPGSGEDRGRDPSHRHDTGPPRWVKAFGVAVGVLLVLFLAVQLATGGGHGPGRHSPSSEVGPTSSAVVQSLAPFEGSAS